MYNQQLHQRSGVLPEGGQTMAGSLGPGVLKYEGISIAAAGSINHL